MDNSIRRELRGRRRDAGRKELKSIGGLTLNEMNGAWDLRQPEKRVTQGGSKIGQRDSGGLHEVF